MYVYIYIYTHTHYVNNHNDDNNNNTKANSSINSNTGIIPIRAFIPASVSDCCLSVIDMPCYLCFSAAPVK